MNRLIIKISAGLGAVAVGLGAFAAHGLREYASEAAITIFETGVRYHFYHVFALLVGGILYGKYHSSALKYACVSFIAGIILFSGSLYLMAFKMSKGVSGLDWLGPITPVGGVAFIAGWILVIFGIPNSKEYKKSKSGK